MGGAECEKRGWIYLGAECLCHAKLGGATRRKRVWPLFETSEVAARLAPWVEWYVSLAPGCIRDRLSTRDLSQSRLEGTWDRFTEPVLGDSGVLRIGTFWMGEKGIVDLRRGNVVKLKPDREGRILTTHKNKVVALSAESESFVVLELKQGRVKLLHDNRAGPLWLWRSIDKIQEVCRSATPVYSINGPGPTVRSMRVPPGENGFLIWDDREQPGIVRPLDGEEIWARKD